MVTPTIIPSFNMPGTTYSWTPRQVLGSGAFGTVFKVTRNDGAVFAMKTLKTRGGYNSFRDELTILHQLRHPNIPELKDLAGDRESPFLITELADATLEQVCAPLPGYYHERIAQAVANQLLDALAFVHSQNPPIVHRDVKSPNILVFRSGFHVVFKLSDFGIAATLGDDYIMSSCGTRGWAAPEIMKKSIKSGYEDRVDVYSLGLVLQSILLGKWSKDRRYHSLEDAPEAAQEVIKLMMQDNPMHRPGASHLKRYTWVKDGGDAALSLTQQMGALQLGTVSPETMVSTVYGPLRNFASRVDGGVTSNPNPSNPLSNHSVFSISQSSELYSGITQSSTFGSGILHSPIESDTFYDTFGPIYF